MTPTEALATLRRLAEARKAISESSGVIAALRRDDFDATVEETDFAALAEAVEGMRSMLLRCCTSVVDPTGREEIDVPNLREAMNHADKADAFVNDQFADMTCRAYQAEDELAAANAEIARVKQERDSARCERNIMLRWLKVCDAMTALLQTAADTAPEYQFALWRAAIEQKDAEIARLRKEYHELAAAVWAQPVDEFSPPDHAKNVAEAEADTVRSGRCWNLEEEIARLRERVGELEGSLDQATKFCRRNPPPDIFVAAEQIIEDAGGLTIQFEVAPDGERVLRLFGESLPCGNRQLNFDQSGQHVGSGTSTQGMCKPGWMVKVDEPESEGGDGE